MRFPRAAAVAVWAVVTIGCASRGAGTPECVMPLSPSIDPQAFSSLAGRYALAQVMTSGPAARNTATGSLDLYDNPDRLTVMKNPDGSVMNGVSAPYRGILKLENETGALIPGDPASDDPERPGALVIVRPTGEPIMRIGSTANDRNRTPIESEYLVYRIRDVNGASFRGTWSSGMREEVAAGFFCATRY